MANYVVKMGQQEDIISAMMKQHQFSLSKGFILLFRVHHIVQQHPDHPDHRLTVKMSERSLDVDFDIFGIFTGKRTTRELMSDVIDNILQLHKDSHGRFLSQHGLGVHLALAGLLDNKPTPVESEDMFIHLFHWYARRLESDYREARRRAQAVERDNRKGRHRFVPIVIECEIVRYYQFIDLNEAIAWWESTPVNVHDMVATTNSSPSRYAVYKLWRQHGLAEAMWMVWLERQIQCSICLEESPCTTDVDVAKLYCSHIFHRHCITEWFRKSRTCPECRMLLD